MLHLHLITKLSPLVRAAVRGALPEEVRRQVATSIFCAANKTISYNTVHDYTAANTL